MGFLDKIKNMFVDEGSEDDVKVEQVKKEVTKVSIESPKVDTYEISDELDINMEEEEEPTFSRPVFFDDNDFKDLNLSLEKEEEKHEEKDLYGRRIETPKIEEKKIFKPTPIISPVYGVLDKNYHKEDIVSRNEVGEATVDLEPSIDSIRNKAYGTLEDELENTLFGNNSILFKQIKEEPTEELELEKLDDDILTNLTEDISKELDELLTKKEKYLENDIEDKEKLKEEKKKEEVTDDILDFIDSTLYRDGDE